MKERTFHERLKILRWAFTFVFVVFVAKLFYLQVVQHKDLYAEAQSQHEKKFELKPRRGKIFVRKNRLTTDLSPLASNNTLKMLYADPVIMTYPKFNPKLPPENQERGNPELAAEILAPLLIHSHCEKVEGCEIITDPTKWSVEEALVIENYKKELLKLITETEVRRVVLKTDVPEGRGNDILKLNLPGIAYDKGKITLDPVRVKNREETAKRLASMLDVDEDVIYRVSRRRTKRYTEIVQKIVPEVSEKIEELKKDSRYRKILRGIGMKDEHWRYYPERELSAQILGFVDRNGRGQYGIEERFNDLLRGKEGFILGSANARNQFVSSNLGIEPAEDGADVVLTIDRVMQGKIEQIIAEDTQKYDADSGQVLVINPQNGHILAMAQYPTFDPNEFGKAFERYEISADQEFQEREDNVFNQRIPTIRDDEGRYYRYYNDWGPEVFKNKMVTELYEPGSVMKAITVAAALNADEIEPKTLYEDKGPIEVLDQYTIKNADDIYAGHTSILEGLIKSRNTMIAYLTRKMGAKLVFDYLQKFGFGEYTDIELPGEQRGVLEHWRRWDESELITRGFGQGISGTALQTIMAFASLANGGYLMQPIIVDETIHSNGKVEKTEPQVIDRVINDQTYQQVKAMLKTSIDKGYAKYAGVEGYALMGKTGTSQTYNRGRALTGEGTTIATFAGFGPYQVPEWVVLVKYDYPKVSQWGSETAAPTFARVADFLIEHFGTRPGM